MPKPKSTSKYAAILPDLPLYIEPKRQDKVEMAKKHITERTPTEMVRNYIQLRRDKQELEDRLADINLLLEAYTQLLGVSQSAQEEGWGLYGVADNALRLATGETLHMGRLPLAQVIDLNALRGWAIANGYEQQLRLWPSTVNKIVKERLMRGIAEPPGVKVFAKTTARLNARGIQEGGDDD